MVQWLGLCAFTAEGPRSVPGQRIKNPESFAAQPKKKKKERERKSIYMKLKENTFLVPRKHMLSRKCFMHLQKAFDRLHVILQQLNHREQMTPACSHKCV